MKNLDKWDRRFLDLAKLISSWSKDPSSQVGSVIVNNTRRIISTGYNGFPKGISDSYERLNNREEKYKYIIHSEMNSIYNAAHEGQSLIGCTLYEYGRIPVCSKCALGIVSSGIIRVVMQNETEIADKWQKEWDISKQIFEECGVKFERFDMNGKSILI